MSGKRYKVSAKDSLRLHISTNDSQLDSTDLQTSSQTSELKRPGKKLQICEICVIKHIIKSKSRNKRATALHKHLITQSEMALYATVSTAAVKSDRTSFN